MCGIACFLSNRNWMEPPDFAFLDKLAAEITACRVETADLEQVKALLDQIAAGFDRLMSFGLHLELIERTVNAQRISRVQGFLKAVQERLGRMIASGGTSDWLEKILETTNDYLWQVEWEIRNNVQRTLDLMPDKNPGGVDRGRHFTAWSLEQVLENLDRLEVRGRDSAGLAVLLLLRESADFRRILTPAQWTELDRRQAIPLAGNLRVNLRQTPTGQTIMVFQYKVANLVGRLGDNTTRLREYIRQDLLLWALAGAVDQINIMAHTRWASNGIISLPNCHPVDAALEGREDRLTRVDESALFVLNGDVDNYQTLLDEVVRGQGYAVHPAITTDAKILPLLYRLGTDSGSSPEDRFSAMVQRAAGSVAIVMQHPGYPRSLFLAQKGSGQSLYLGKTADGWLVASEIYGLAARTRTSYGLPGAQGGGVQVTLEVGRGAGESLAGNSWESDLVIGRFLDDDRTNQIPSEPIYLFSRDIYRGAYDYYLEKEIREAPESVRKTIKGKYRSAGNRVDFPVADGEYFNHLVSRLHNPDRPPIRRIMIIGQGTAAVAAMGTAHLIDRALAGSGIRVDWSKASEVSGFSCEQSLDDTLLIAISQSGTTTDTNRTVDVARSRGAWIHVIVNRRNSPLVSKSDSCLYTSDGRDVEMSVASTKAFYSQAAAGKLLALLLAQEFKTMTDEAVYQEIRELETLPDKIEQVLANDGAIRECAENYGPRSRNWAVVGNGPNRVAAEEIRIKLSELCYKSIPCDVTEDKKHIDLSTEPLTIVVANDLPDRIVQDTAKEVSIFKAHSGRPLVFCVEGETRFNEYAQEIIRLPRIEAGLGFVLATVAGHLWGFYTAKAIDRSADEFRHIRAMMTSSLEDLTTWNPRVVPARFAGVMERIEAGDMNASLQPSTVSQLARYWVQLENLKHETDGVGEVLQAGIMTLNKVIDELTRPIDTIRHQAKTVTVGISRPMEELPARLVSALEALAVSPARLTERDNRLLRTVAPLIAEVTGGMFYRIIEDTAAGPDYHRLTIQALKRYGFSQGKASRYDFPQPAAGSKRKAIRLERAVWSSGQREDENVLIIPLIEPETRKCSAMALLHLSFVTELTVAQKHEILKGLGERYDDLIERLEETSRAARLDDILDRVTPRDLIFLPLDDMLTLADNDSGSVEPIP
ncbi:MAG: SIS domain-containing protein [Deltaproteobacteria bacterium]|nr:SIS domain-containing protein [Deltaproteobacteria bacterium]